MEKPAPNSCFAKGRRRHFRKFYAFARFFRRDVIMAWIIGSAKSDVLTQGGLEALPMIQRVKVRASFHRRKQDLS